MAIQLSRLWDPKRLFYLTSHYVAVPPDRDDQSVR